MEHAVNVAEFFEYSGRVEKCYIGISHPFSATHSGQTGNIL